MTKSQTDTHRVAVVAGGMGYVGSAIAKQLAADGLQVVVLYHRSPQDAVEKFLAELAGSGHRAYPCNLEDFEEVSKTVAAVEQEVGLLYIAVDASGSLPQRKQLHQTSNQELRDQFDRSVFSSFNFLSACARVLKGHKQGVLIGITTAMVASTLGTKARGAYSPIKFAIQGMLVALKEELASDHVRVYSVAPSFMPGGFNKDMPKAFVDMIREASPTKTLIEAPDVARAVSFLCSDEGQRVNDLTLLIGPESGTL